jgi:hypothetical protein
MFTMYHMFYHTICLPYFNIKCRDVIIKSIVKAVRCILDSYGWKGSGILTKSDDAIVHELAAWLENVIKLIMSTDYSFEGVPSLCNCTVHEKNSSAHKWPVGFHLIWWGPFCEQSVSWNVWGTSLVSEELPLWPLGHAMSCHVRATCMFLQIRFPSRSSILLQKLGA